MEGSNAHASTYSVISAPFLSEFSCFLHHNNQVLSVATRFCLESGQTMLAAGAVCDYHLLVIQISSCGPIQAETGGPALGTK